MGKKNNTTVFPRKSLSETGLPLWSGKVNSGALSLMSMGVSPSRSTLYLTGRQFVILGSMALTMLAQPGPAQIARAAKVNKGPRALGLVELAPNGKAHLIPIAILYDGKFYDAGAYKASPVPMALESETVYEGIRTGVSQGLFTVTAALERKVDNTWIAEGTWLPAGSMPPKSANKPAASSKPRGMDEDEGPPKLRRSGSEKAKAPETTPSPSAPAQPAAPQTAPSSASGAASSTSPATIAQAAATAAVTTASASSPAPSADQTDADQTDKDRPVLRRGKPAPKPAESPGKPLAAPPKTAAHPSATPAAFPASQIQLIPAISDADGPEPRPYTYSLKPEEEQQFRSKMLALATQEIQARAKQLAQEMIGATPPPHTPAPRGRATRVKPPQPSFEDAQLRVFDLSNTNEPEAVLTAKARLPQRISAKDAPDLQYFVTLVVREDVNGDFHKALVNVTDTQHLDVLPRFELIDAVDADGDGRGELLFRQVSDAGTAFVVYRVIGNQLWPLFQGTPE